VVDRSSFSCIGSVFHACGAATEKAVSPIRRRVGGTTRSPTTKHTVQIERVHRQLISDILVLEFVLVVVFI